MRVRCCGSQRHIRKYAEGDLTDRRFVLRGPENRLKLGALNFTNFIRIGAGVDDETWRHHLKRHDDSQWIRSVTKDQALADEVEAFEKQDVPAKESRDRIFAAIRAKYTASA
jgi:hypothetical protein